MGTWGTGILDDDLARDVYDAYVAGAELGKTPAAIVRTLRRTHAGELTDPAQDAVFWLALAHAQRDLGGVHRDVHERVVHIVRAQVGIEPWLEIGAVEAGRRKAVLTRFLASLSRPGSSKQPSKRSTKAANEAVDYEVGDCLSIALEDGRFAAAIVTREKRASTAPSHILTLIDAIGSAPPSATVFDPPRWLVLAPVEFPGQVRGLRRGTRPSSCTLSPDHADRARRRTRAAGAARRNMGDALARGCELARAGHGPILGAVHSVVPSV